MGTTRILRGMTVAVATVTAAVAVALFALQGQTNAVAEVPMVPALPDSTTTPTTTTTTTPPTTTTTPPTTAVPPTTAPEPEPETPAGALRPGARGPAVLALQQRLHHLGYWLGPADGTYGDLTRQAVMAFQKVEGLERDGIVGERTRAVLAGAGRPTTEASGDLIEVDKDRQVLLVVRNGAVRWVLNVSTGTEEPYWINGRAELADTPAGHWQVAWAVDGLDVGELGGLYRPRYFHRDGIAVHGYSDVPAHPASHGCVRVSNPAMDWIWAQGVMPVGSPVWVH